MTPEAAASLRREYALDEKERGVGGLLLVIFGAVLVLGGIILLLAHNWEELPASVRLGAGLLPLLVTIVLGARLVAQDAAGTGVREAVGIANSLAVALAISITAQVYQISGDTARFLMTWFVLTLPTTYLLRSGTSWVIGQTLLIYWGFEVEPAPWLAAAYAGLAAGSSLLFWLPSWQNERQGTLGWLRTYGALVGTLGVAVCLRRVDGTGWYALLYSVWFGLVLAQASGPGEGRSGFRTWFARIGLVSMWLCFTHRYWWENPTFSMSHRWLQEAALAEWAVIAIATFGLVAVLARTWRTLHRMDLIWSAGGLLGVVVVGLSALRLPLGLGVTIFNLICATLAALTLRRAVVERDTSRLNAGWLFLSALIVVRFFDSELSYLARGLVFIALGLGFLGLNIWSRRRTQS